MPVTKTEIKSPKVKSENKAKPAGGLFAPYLTGVFSVRKISVVGSHINEKLYRQKGEVVRVNYNQLLTYSPLGLIDFTLGVSYLYEDKPNEILFATEVQTVFEIPNIKEYINAQTNALTIPTDLLVMIVSISVSHTRALLARQCAGTIYNDILLPIVNPLEMAQAFFPERFKG